MTNQLKREEKWEEGSVTSLFHRVRHARCIPVNKAEPSYELKNLPRSSILFKMTAQSMVMSKELLGITTVELSLARSRMDIKQESMLTSPVLFHLTDRVFTRAQASFVW